MDGVCGICIGTRPETHPHGQSAFTDTLMYIEFIPSSSLAGDSDDQPNTDIVLDSRVVNIFSREPIRPKKHSGTLQTLQSML